MAHTLSIIETQSFNPFNSVFSYSQKMAENVEVNTQQILQYYHHDHLTKQSIKRKMPDLSIETIANAIATPTIEEQLDSLMAKLSTDLQVAYIKRYLRSNVTAWEEVVSEGLGKLPRTNNL